MARKQKPDVKIAGGVGQTVFQVWPLTKKARQWVEDRCDLEDYQWFGKACFVVEWRYIGDLVRGAQAEGLRVADERV